MLILLYYYSTFYLPKKTNIKDKSILVSITWLALWFRLRNLLAFQWLRRLVALVACRASITELLSQWLQSWHTLRKVNWKWCLMAIGKSSGLLAKQIVLLKIKILPDQINWPSCDSHKTIYRERERWWKQNKKGKMKSFHDTNLALKNIIWCLIGVVYPFTRPYFFVVIQNCQDSRFLIDLDEQIDPQKIAPPLLLGLRGSIICGTEWPFPHP